MLKSFLATASPMMVMFICILIGFLLRKTKAMPENGATVLSKLEIYVLLPARIVSTFVESCTVESILAHYNVVLYGCVAVALSVAMGIPLARMFAKERNLNRIYQYALIHANFGFLGNAIVPQIMGDEAMYLYMLFTLPLNIEMYLWALNTLIPEGKGQKKGLLQSLMNPTVIALGAGLALGLSGVGAILPGFVTTTVDNLADCMGPVAMILTGFVVGGYNIGELLQNKKVYLMAVLRLFLLPTVIIGVLWLLGADKTVLLLSIFAYATALGLNTVVIPAAYDGDTHPGAAMAMISHVACVVTIPLMYALFDWIL